MGDQLTSPQPLLNNASESARLVQNPSSLWRSLRLDRLIEFALRPPIILLTLVTVMLSRGITQGEFFFYGDETRHAMNGVFFRDFISDLPLRHPLQYVYEYYAKYPAIAFPHWPPLFHLIEGVFFLLFGLSPWVSRLVILGFALLAVYFWYRIAERLGPRYRAFLSAVILASMPFIFLYERVTMLEIPALAACLGAIHFWLKFIESERRRDLLTLAGFVVGAFLISQKAIFLVFFIGFDLLIERRFLSCLKRVDVWSALLVSALAVLPWYWAVSRTTISLSSRLFGHGYGHAVLNKYGYTFYLIKLYGQLGSGVASSRMCRRGCCASETNSSRSHSARLGDLRLHLLHADHREGFSAHNGVDSTAPLSCTDGLRNSDATPRVGSHRYAGPRICVLGDCGSIRASEVEWRRGSRSVCPFAAGVRYRLLPRGTQWRFYFQC